VIDGETSEEVHFTFNETERILECKSGALPPASITWTKNDETVEQKMVIWKQNGTSILMFHIVGHETQANYKCIASNYAGKDEKIFHVFVEGRSSVSLYKVTNPGRLKSLYQI
jgi:hypothetical protein